MCFRSKFSKLILIECEHRSKSKERAIWDTAWIPLTRAPQFGQLILSNALNQSAKLTNRRTKSKFWLSFKIRMSWTKHKICCRINWINSDLLNFAKASWLRATVKKCKFTTGCWQISSNHTDLILFQKTYSCPKLTPVIFCWFVQIAVDFLGHGLLELILHLILITFKLFWGTVTP